MIDVYQAHDEEATWWVAYRHPKQMATTNTYSAIIHAKCPAYDLWEYYNVKIETQSELRELRITEALTRCAAAVPPRSS